MPGRAAIGEGFSPSSCFSPGDLICTPRREPRLYYLRTLAGKTDRPCPTVCFPGGNRRRKVQVGTGRRMIARARDSPSCFIHACLVNLDIPVRITWRTWLYPGSGLVNPLWSGVWQIGRNQRKKKRKLWIFSLSFFFLLFQEECCAFFWLARGFFIVCLVRHSQKVKDCIRCIVQAPFPNISDIQAAILSRSWSQFFFFFSKRIKVAIIECNRSFCP